MYVKLNYLFFYCFRKASKHKLVSPFSFFVVSVKRLQKRHIQQFRQQQTCHIAQGELSETFFFAFFKPYNNVIHLFIFLQLLPSVFFLFCVCDNIKKEIYVNWIKWKTFFSVSFWLFFFTFAAFLAKVHNASSCLYFAFASLLPVDIKLNLRYVDGKIPWHKLSNCSRNLLLLPTNIKRKLFRADLLFTVRRNCVHSDGSETRIVS